MTDMRSSRQSKPIQCWGKAWAGLQMQYLVSTIVRTTDCFAEACFLGILGHAYPVASEFIPRSASLITKLNQPHACLVQKFPWAGFGLIRFILLNAFTLGILVLIFELDWSPGRKTSQLL